MRFACAGLTALFASAAFSQSPDGAPKFEIADVHVSAKTRNPFARTGPVRNGRYEIKTATMVDLVRIAYGFDADKILGGPNWLELDRFDVIAKVPSESTAETQKQMLQTLLEDRFKLQVRKETRPLPAYALTAGKKLQLKEADGSGEPGCKLQSASGPPPEGTQRLTMMNGDGTTTAINLGPGATLHFVCRNMTMAAFAAGLREMFGASLGTSPVTDETGLKGTWNFDVRWSLPLLPLGGDAGDRITVFDAIDKQLGLKLELKQHPTPVLVVDKVNRTPTENPPGVAEALPTPPAPTEFEVADVKPTNPDGRTPSRVQFQPGGRFLVQSMPMRFLVTLAFPDYTNDGQVIGLPGWAETNRFDVTALAPAIAQPSFIDSELLGPMMRSLLVDEFKLAYHTEERSLAAYRLVSAKPKMKKADPESRIFCKNQPAPPTAARGSLTIACQNISMAEFAEWLRGRAPGLTMPILDATEIEGGWDFTLTYTQLPPQMVNAANAPGRGGDNGPPDSVPQAADPSGGYTVFEAVEKQLGLKLETQKRSMPVVVIDHIEQRPVD
ncbi:MAG TPA: TIGR03435 family protein [Bryobacteraceae bacterium]